MGLDRSTSRSLCKIEKRFLLNKLSVMAVWQRSVFVNRLHTDLPLGCIGEQLAQSPGRSFKNI